MCQDVANSNDDATTRHAILAWERLRIVYNVILAPAAYLGRIAFGWQWNLSNSDATIAFALFMLGANICYFFGPVSEIYLRALFGVKMTDGRRKRLFVYGLLFSLGLGLVLLVVSGEMSGPHGHWPAA